METKTAIFVLVLIAIPSGLTFISLHLFRLSRRIVISGTIATIVLLASFEYFSLDGLDGLVFKATTPDDTEFAKTYSSIGFWRVHEGMTPEQVKRLVGPPLETYPLPGGFGWRWSRSPHDSNYRIRVVTFVAGRAFAKFSEYYVD